MNTVKSRRRQRGDSLLLSLFMLTLMTLGLFAVMRSVKNDAQMSGILGWHMRGRQIADVVLAQTLVDMGNAVPNDWETKAWFRTGTNLAVPLSSDWKGCLHTPVAGSRCDQVSQNPDVPKLVKESLKGFEVYRVVQKTTASEEKSSSCDGATATYYRIFIHVEESSGNGAKVDMEGIYRACV